VSSLALLVRRPKACLFLFVFTVLLALSFFVLVLFLVALVSSSKP
jgi:preprotein translocase subunit SecG